MPSRAALTTGQHPGGPVAKSQAPRKTSPSKDFPRRHFATLRRDPATMSPTAMLAV